MPPLLYKLKKKIIAFKNKNSLFYLIKKPYLQNYQMGRKNISPLNFWVCFLIVATIFGDLSCVKGNSFDWPTTPLPCTDEYCDYACKKIGCGHNYCLSGKCINNPKFRESQNPVCHCHDHDEE